MKLYPISKEESIDIDDYTDLSIAEGLAQKLRIRLMPIYNKEVGTGHLYRCLTLGNMFRNSGHEVKIFNNLMDKVSNEFDIEFIPYAEDYDIIILDTLGTYKAKGFIVSFEDLNRYGNLTINSIYDGSMEHEVIDYPFLVLPQKPLKELENVMISFGGVDSKGYTLQAINELNHQDVNLSVVLGSLNSLKLESKDRLKVYRNLDEWNFAKLMNTCDLVITSAGRTLYNAIYLKKPVIVLAQNEREKTHTLIKEPYINYREKVEGIVLDLTRLKSKSRRESLIRNYPNFELNNQRVKNLILSEYRRWQCI